MKGWVFERGLDPKETCKECMSEWNEEEEDKSSSKSISCKVKTTTIKGELIIGK